MRFNDLLDTVLNAPPVGAGAPVTRWRQCVDLLAQYDRAPGPAAGSALTADQLDRVEQVLRDLAPRLTIAQRLASVVELGSRIASPRLVRLFAADHSAVCSAAMVRAMLDDRSWVELIPSLGPLARSVLRRRTDLSGAARAMLAHFGPIDLSLPAATIATDTASPAYAQRVAVDDPEPASDIARIVERIERFTARRERTAQPETPSVEIPAREGHAFSFETDALGVIQQVQGAPSVSVEGLSIAAAAVDGRSGPDGQMLGAFRRRASFRDLRYIIAEGALYGEWRVSAEPQFDAGNGRFRGYSGTARRPLPSEQPVAAQMGMEASVTPASTRQLVHELRTPLNAIQGFAEIIEQQLMGPVPPPYRAMARQIIEDATRLIGLFDDLDLASRIARGDDRRRLGQIDLAAMVGAALERFGGSSDAGARQAGDDRIVLRVSHGLPAVTIDRVQAERMIAHLVRIVHAALAPRESVEASLSAGVAGVVLSMERPAALRGVDEATLLDPSSPLEQDDPDGPPLGIAFGLRLVRSLAHHAGGRLEIAERQFTLQLPAAHSGLSEGRHR